MSLYCNIQAALNILGSVPYWDGKQDLVLSQDHYTQSRSHYFNYLCPLCAPSAAHVKEEVVLEFNGIHSHMIHTNPIMYMPRTDLEGNDAVAFFRPLYVYQSPGGVI
jgi:hypothetical protein